MGRSLDLNEPQLHEPDHEGAHLGEEGQRDQGAKATRRSLRDRHRGGAERLRLPAHGEQKTVEAIAIFDKNVKAHPQSWNVYDSLAEAYGIKGDKKKAIENLHQGSEPHNRRDAKDPDLGSDRTVEKAVGPACQIVARAKIDVPCPTTDSTVTLPPINADALTDSEKAEVCSSR